MLIPYSSQLDKLYKCVAVGVYFCVCFFFFVSFIALNFHLIFSDWSAENYFCPLCNHINSLFNVALWLCMLVKCLATTNFSHGQHQFKINLRNELPNDHTFQIKSKIDTQCPSYLEWNLFNCNPRYRLNAQQLFSLLKLCIWTIESKLMNSFAIAIVSQTQ